MEPNLLKTQKYAYYHVLRDKKPLFHMMAETVLFLYHTINTLSYLLHFVVSHNGSGLPSNMLVMGQDFFFHPEDNFKKL